MTAAALPPPGNCPECGNELTLLWGCEWDWDIVFCKCGYEKELDVSTGYNDDGTIWQMKKEIEE